jgi:hypothetical protein
MDSIWNWLWNIDSAEPIPEGRELVFDFPAHEGWVLAAVFGALAVLIYVIAFYRRESRTVGGRLGTFLAVMRVAAIAVAVIVLMRPRLKWQVPKPPEDPDEQEPEPPALVFLVDESRSMDFIDVASDAPDSIAERVGKTLEYAIPGALRGKARLTLVKEAFGKEAERLVTELRKPRKSAAEEKTPAKSPADPKAGKASDTKAAKAPEAKPSRGPSARVQIYAFSSQPRELYNEPWKRKSGKVEAVTSAVAGADAKSKPGEKKAEKKAEEPAAGSVERVVEMLRLESAGVFPGGKDAEKSTDAMVKAAYEDFNARRGITNLGGSLRGVLEKSGGKVYAVVVVSDGRSNEGDTRAAEELAKRFRVPVHTVGVGNPERLANLNVAALLGGDSPRRRQAFTLRMLVSHDNLADKTVETVVQRRRVERDEKGNRIPGRDEDWQNVDGPGPFRLNPDGRIQEVTFQARSEEIGEFEYRAKAKVTDGEETTDKDNERTLDIRVLDDRPKVLLVASDPNWEYRALKNMLIRSFGLRASVFLQGSSADFSQEASGDDPTDRELISMRVVTLPRSREKLSKYDVIVLMDPAYSTSPLEDGALDRRICPNFVRIVNELVTDRGIGLVYIAGVKNTPTLFDERESGDSAKPLFKPLQDLIPVVPEKFALRLHRGIQVGFPMSITEKEGRFHPILRFIERESPEEAVQANLPIWERLPKVYWAMPVREVKPSALILAEHSSPNFRLGDQLLPLLAEQRSGVGRSMYFGFDSTWRWRFLGDSTFTEFWSRTITYMVEGRRLGGRRRVRLITDGKDVYRSHDPIELTAELLNAKFDPLSTKNRKAHLTLSRRAEGAKAGEATAVEDVELTEIEGRPGVYRGRFVPRLGGQYEAALRREPTSGDPDEELPSDDVRLSINVAGLDREAREREANLAELRRLANDTGGRYVSVGRFGDLVDTLKEGPPEPKKVIRKPGKPDEKEKTLWDVPFWLILFSCVLFAEWAVRKFRNLA